MEKSPEAFRTISEVAEELEVPKHVLRFWEGKFSQLRPMKRGGGRRYYRPEDVDLLRGIRQLLYGDGYTIKGVQKILRQQGVRYVMDYNRFDDDGDTGLVREIPDVASEAARSAIDPHVHSPEGLSDDDPVEHPADDDPPFENNGVLDPQVRRQLQALLGELEECRKALEPEDN
ncbi:MAG: MerR family transcriptional regulator [Hyphomicrobiales bacterium]|nr:MerR family transcriptional regulator [Hyphomicrobiales bacterium]